MTLALVSNDTSLLLVIAPNSSVAAFWGLSLFLIFWLQSPFELMIVPVLFRDYLVLKINVQLTEVTFKK